MKAAAHTALAARAITLLDAPVSGSGDAADAGRLFIIVSGDEAAYDAVADILPAIAGNGQRYVGPFGTGIRLKLIINSLVTTHAAAFAEAVVVAEKAGVDLELMFAAVKAGAGNSRVAEYRGPLMVAGTYAEPATQTAKLAVQVKDNHLIADFARSMYVPTPCFNAAAMLYDAAASMGFAHEDPAVICRVLEHMAGIARD